MLATGQRPSEHPRSVAVVILAKHLGKNIPAEISHLLEADRQSEERWEMDAIPDTVAFTTQARNGDELQLAVPREMLMDYATIEEIADRMMSGEAERRKGIRLDYDNRLKLWPIEGLLSREIDNAETVH